MYVYIYIYIVIPKYNIEVNHPTSIASLTTAPLHSPVVDTTGGCCDDDYP